MNSIQNQIRLLAATTLLLAGSVSASDPTYSWGNFVGQPGGSGNADGTGSTARFNKPFGAAVDSAGNVYVADTANHTIRQVTTAGVVTTLAGSAGNPGYADGTNNAAQFNSPTGVAVDTDGNLYVADAYNYVIRKLMPSGGNWVVTTLAGRAGSFGSADGTGSAARFYAPQGVAVDTTGNVYVADTYNHTIREVTPAGVVTTLAGLPGSFGSADGTNSAARFYSPHGVAVDNAGNVYVADTYNHTIRQVTPAGVVTTLAGRAGFYGSADGTNSTARFDGPSGVAVDTTGNVYVADTYNHTIREVSPAGVVTTLAGSAGSFGIADGTNSAARFDGPSGVAVDSAGNVYVADTYNHTIREVTPSGVVTTLAGTAENAGAADGTGNAARFNQPIGVAVDSVGNLYVADQTNNMIRQVTFAGVVTTLAGSTNILSGGSSNAGSQDGVGGTAQFNGPAGVAVDSVGNVYVADTYNHTIRQVTPAGAVSTLANSSGTFGGRAAPLNGPFGIAVNTNGIVIVADTYNQTIWEVNAAGTVTVLAGNSSIVTTNGPVGGYLDGTGKTARFNAPHGVALDSAGNVYVADTFNHVIRLVTPAGVVSTLAGSAGNPGFADGTNSAAQFNQPYGVAVDSAGNVYVADTYNHTVRKIMPSGTNWVVTTIGGADDVIGGADGVGSAANFDLPVGIAVDSAFNLYVTDKNENRVAIGTPSYVPLTIITTSPLQSGLVGTSYNQAVTAIGGATPYTWSLVSGSLPAGLGLDTSSGAVTGTPTVATTASFLVRVTGADSQFVEKNFSLSTYASSSLTITKMQMGLDFTHVNNDSCSLTATLDLGGAIYNLANKVVTLDIGGAQVPFLMDAKGKGRGASWFGSCTLVYNKKTGLWTLNAKLSRGTWQIAWAAYGLTGATTPKQGVSVTVPVTMVIDAGPFTGSQTMTYTATYGKSGLTK